jgi:hypothetical protein
MPVLYLDPLVLLVLQTDPLAPPDQLAVEEVEADQLAPQAQQVQLVNQSLAPPDSQVLQAQQVQLVNQSLAPPDSQGLQEPPVRQVTLPDQLVLEEQLVQPGQLVPQDQPELLVSP